MCPTLFTLERFLYFLGSVVLSSGVAGGGLAGLRVSVDRQVKGVFLGEPLSLHSEVN